MLYRTLQSLFHKFPLFSILTLPLPSLPLSSVQPHHLLLHTFTLFALPGAHLQAPKEMECVEAALKTSFRTEMSIKTSSLAILEDMCTLNAQSGAPCDDFFVDDLLDFSNQEALLEEQVDEEGSKVFSVPVSPQKDTQWHGISLPSSTFIAIDDFGALPNNELSVPAEELADLEWLSHFVEDSFSEQSASVAYSAGTLAKEPKQHAFAEGKIPELENTLEVSNTTCFDSPVPAKARSKRTKTVVRVWSLGSPSLTESSSTSTSSCSSSSSTPGPRLLYASSTTHITEPVSTSEATVPLVKNPKKKKVSNWSGLSSVGGGGQAPRRCSHCGVQKTPQWRAGPLGAKTLCNACGVRYKSGRLLPEYRPACSPTFSSHNHSNHHRKVLEMRRKKELESGLEPGLTVAAVRSF